MTVPGLFCPINTVMHPFDDKKKKIENLCMTCIASEKRHTFSKNVGKDFMYSENKILALNIYTSVHS